MLFEIEANSIEITFFDSENGDLNGDPAAELQQKYTADFTVTEEVNDYVDAVTKLKGKVASTAIILSQACNW